MASTVTDHSNVDVLIVGAGPAGLMMAAWMATCGVKTRIIDKRGTKIFNGQADAINMRTMEIFDSFGFADRVLKEGNPMIELSLWNTDSNGRLQRSDRKSVMEPGTSRFPQMVLHQGRIERFSLDYIERCSGIRVERGVLPTKLEIDDALVGSLDAYPITVHLRHLSEAEATPKQMGTAVNGCAIQDGLFRSNLSPDDTEELLKTMDGEANKDKIIKAKYMVGADGAHSWVRQELGFSLEGESTDYVWGVLDMVPITDFPDIRTLCTMQSADSGSILVIPRENKLVRLYIQLTTTAYNSGKRADRSKINPDVILEAAQKILAPYQLSYRKLDWWTAYQIGQRVGTRFSAHERIFLAGDAIHTHSPKVGQGMNVSMHDSYNLGWKVASVIKGVASPSILKTYELERRGIAQDLITFDYWFSRLLSDRPVPESTTADRTNPGNMKEAFERYNLFLAGCSVDYGHNTIVKKEDERSSIISIQELAPGIKVGMRVPSVKVLNQADGRPWHLQQRLPSDGRWRVVVFAGDVTKQAQKDKLEVLGAALGSKESFLQRFTPAEARYDAVIEVLTVHAAPRKQLGIFDFPEVFRPYDDIEGWDYDKIFVDDVSYHEGHGRLYETWGIDPNKGCLVILRPDQYVSYIGPLEDYDAVDRFFSGFMVAQAV
ncbi:putative FAD monooxygenase [Aspergillus stella-maris]|uniref:putative FAD monooxygenase n=1 Tax=Aspergillus stella-maris TaxID=1810926 RepID=UPI003CCE32C5